MERLGLKPHDYFARSCHREEDVESEQNFAELVASVHALSEKYHKRIIFSVHLRNQKKIAASWHTFPTYVVIKPLSSVSLDKTLLNTRTDFAFQLKSYPEKVREMKD